MNTFGTINENKADFFIINNKSSSFISSGIWKGEGWGSKDANFQI